jgi:hypothetical protein
VEEARERRKVRKYKPSEKGVIELSSGRIDKRNKKKYYELHELWDLLEDRYIQKEEKGDYNAIDRFAKKIKTPWKRAKQEGRITHPHGTGDYYKAREQHIRRGIEALARRKFGAGMKDKL